MIHPWYNVTYLPTRSLIHEHPPIILVTREDNIILDVVGFTSQSIWILLKKNRRGCQNRYGWYHITDMWGTSPEWKNVDKFVCFIYNTYYIVYIYIGLCSYIFEYILDYILHYIYVVGRIRNTKEQNTKCQSSHHDTTILNSTTTKYYKFVDR